MMAYLVDLGPQLFVPTSGRLWERFEEYYSAYIAKNAALMARAHLLFAASSYRKFLAEMTEGQRHLCLLGYFDAEVNNSGISQFLSNSPHLAGEIARSRSAMASIELLDSYTAVLTSYAKGQDAAADECSSLLESRYYPRWDEVAGKFCYDKAVLRLELCSKTVDYVEKHPRDFQLL